MQTPVYGPLYAATRRESGAGARLVRAMAFPA